MLRKLLTHLKKDTEELNYGRELISGWALEQARSSGSDTFRILDIGMGPAVDLENIENTLNSAGISFELYGLDSYLPSVKAAPQNIDARLCNIESDQYPFEDQYFDLILSNQVIEHTKEIFWIFSEISRLLKPSGVAITGVPNIASFHNRIGMLFGVQPTNIELLGPHVRGFTAGSFIQFIETDGYFKNLDVRGSNFYPLPRFLAKFLARIFPRAAVSIFMLTQRTNKPGPFHDVLESRFFETPFYRGPQFKPETFESI